MATQIQDLRATPIEMLREMRSNPGVYSRALIAQTIAEKEAQEPPSQFRQDYEGMKRGLQPVVRDVADWWKNNNDRASRAAALQKMVIRLPGVSPLGYFTSPAPERQQSKAILDFYNKNREMLERDPDAFQAFVSNPAAFVTMQNRVLTPREKGDRLAPTVEANGAPPAPAQMAGAEPDTGPESIPAPYLPPLMAGAGGLPPGFNGTMAQGDVPPWLRPKAPDGGAVGEGGSTAGGRPVIPTAPVPAQNPAMAAITAGQQAASETVAPAVAAAAAGPEAAGVAEATGAMSPELKQATQDYLKLIGDTGGDTDERDRYLSLAKAGFAMASSGSPYLLQAVGQGGTAGIDAYQAARAKSAERRLRQAQGTLEVAKLGEDVRRAGVREGLDRGRLDLEKDKAAKEAADREATRGIQREELDIRREGQRLQSAYQNRPDYNILGQDENGNAIIYDQRSGGTKVLPGVKATGRGAGADVEKALEVRQRIVNEMYPQLSREERADIVFGRSIPSATELRVKAREMAQKELGDAADYRLAGGKDKIPYDQAVARKTEEIMSYLRGGGAPPAPAAAAPSAPAVPGATIRYDAQGNRLP